MAESFYLGYLELPPENHLRNSDKPVTTDELVRIRAIMNRPSDIDGRGTLANNIAFASGHKEVSPKMLDLLANARTILAVTLVGAAKSGRTPDNSYFAEHVVAGITEIHRITWGATLDKAREYALLDMYEIRGALYKEGMLSPAFAVPEPKAVAAGRLTTREPTPKAAAEAHA